MPVAMAGSARAATEPTPMDRPAPGQDKALDKPTTELPAPARMVRTAHHPAVPGSETDRARLATVAATAPDRLLQAMKQGTRQPVRMAQMAPAPTDRIPAAPAQIMAPAVQAVRVHQAAAQQVAANNLTSNRDERFAVRMQTNGEVFGALLFGRQYRTHSPARATIAAPGRTSIWTPLCSRRSVPAELMCQRIGP